MIKDERETGKCVVACLCQVAGRESLCLCRVCGGMAGK